MTHPIPALPRPTALGASTREAAKLLTARGVDPGPILHAAGLSLEAIKDRARRILADKQIKFLGLVSRRLDDELLGLHLGGRFEPREAGLLYFVMASSSTFGEALRNAERYTCLVNDGVRLTALRAGETGLECAYLGVPRQADRHQIEFFMMVIVKIAQQLTGRRLRPSRVAIAHPPCQRRKEAEALLGSEITYNAAADQIAFEPSTGDAALPGADPYLNELLARYCEEARRTTAPQPGTFRTRVENAILPLLPHGRATLPEVARALGASTRSLSRALAAEEMTFSAVLQALRLDLAGQYLRTTDLPITEIAWLLGFQNSTAFTHFYRRSVGCAPSHERGRGPPAHHSRQARGGADRSETLT